MREGEAQGLDDLMVEMTACERERQQTDQPMCHIAARTLSSLISFFLPSVLVCYFSPLSFLFIIFTLPHFLISHSSTLMPCFLKILYFSSHPASSIPITPCHSRQNYYSWMEHRLSGAVRHSLRPHYPFMEYPFLWRAIFLQPSDDRRLGDPVHLHCNTRHSHQSKDCALSCPLH